MHPSNHANPTSIRPQNTSCPAGGASSFKNGQAETADSGERGVIVAPPSPNTSPPEWLVLHRGFDTVTLSIKATIPQDFYEHLTKEKARAEELREDVLTEFNGVRLHLKPYGGRGYAFIASGGPHGATWSFKAPNIKDPWGIRLTLGSEILAVFGLGGAKAHVETVLECLGIRFKAEDVSMARVDFCTDILAPDFRLIPDQFVLPASTNRQDYVDSFKVNGKSGRVSSVTAGTATNRQVIIYDKRAEVISCHKRHWWTIWQYNLDKLNAQGVDVPTMKLDPTDPTTSRVWRIELRAGKRLLKDRWNIRTWEDLFDRFGDLCRETGELIRYCAPTHDDTNRARWPNHPIWEIACAEINDDLSEMRSGVDPQVMKEVHKETHIGLIARNILGNVLTHAALNGREYEDLPEHFTKLAKDMTEQSRKSPDKTRRQLKAAKERYAFLQSERRKL